MLDIVKALIMCYIKVKNIIAWVAIWKSETAQNIQIFQVSASKVERSFLHTGLPPVALVFSSLLSVMRVENILRTG